MQEEAMRAVVAPSTNDERSGNWMGTPLFERTFAWIRDPRSPEG